MGPGSCLAPCRRGALVRGRRQSAVPGRPCSVGRRRCRPLGQAVVPQVAPRRRGQILEVGRFLGLGSRQRPVLRFHRSSDAGGRPARLSPNSEAGLPHPSAGASCEGGQNRVRRLLGQPALQADPGRRA
eukprot:13655509-Alexandrium_andersonii.AAC.1